MKEELEKYLKPTYFADSNHPRVTEFARQHISETLSPREKAVKLYLAVRDGFYYNPYILDFKKESLKAGYLLSKKQAYCVEKAIMLAAVYRAANLPARLGFVVVRNHIGTEKLEKYLQTDKFVFHGYTDVFVEGKWVKATPAFNKALCDKLNVDVLEFDGKSDSVFQEYDKSGGRYMEYLHDYGKFDDLPYDLFLSELKKHYGHLFESEFYNKQSMILRMP